MEVQIFYMNRVTRKYKSWKKSYHFRRYYCTIDRRPFYDIAAKYLPTDESAIIVDIGSGEGQFTGYLNLVNKYKNLFLLDGNSFTIKNMRSKFWNAILYKAPEKLPFESATVSYIHCSHLIEHLFPKELYQFLKEVDRVLDKDGIFVVSSPMLWSGFYGDLSHVKPYNPDVILNYLCRRSKNRSVDIISENYTKLELIYRYTNLELDEGLGSNLQLVDFMIQIAKWLFSKLGLKKYVKNGYTLVLKKSK